MFEAEVTQYKENTYFEKSSIEFASESSNCRLLQLLIYGIDISSKTVVTLVEQ